MKTKSKGHIKTYSSLTRRVLAIRHTVSVGLGSARRLKNPLQSLVVNNNTAKEAARAYLPITISPKIGLGFKIFLEKCCPLAADLTQQSLTH